MLNFLSERGFKTFKDQAPDPQFFFIRAQRDTCNMDLREVAPRGYDRFAMRTQAAGRHLFYVDNGAVSPEQPAWRTWLHLYFRRFAGFLGWPLAKRLTFAVMQNASCADLDWAELSKRHDTDAANTQYR